MRTCIKGSLHVRCNTFSLAHASDMDTVAHHDVEKSPRTSIELVGDKAESIASITVHGEELHSYTKEDVVDEDYPDGGWRAWLTVLGAFLALTCTFGQLSSFGTFQSWYSEHQLSDLPPSTISWIGALQLWVFFFSVRSALLLSPVDSRDL